MDNFRYGLAVSVLFDEETDDETKLVPAAVLESPEAKERFSAYERIRRELRGIFFREIDVPEDVERRLFARIRGHEYKLLQPRNERISFSLVNFGRILRRRMRHESR